jgi:hypothetical protein
VQMDDEDYRHYQEWNWHISFGVARDNGERALYLTSTNAELRNRYLKSKVYFHCLINNFASDKYDFIDGNTLNVQKKNIRPCSRSQDGRNTKIRKQEGKTSKYKGVIYDKNRDKWIASISLTTDEPSTTLGRYNSEIEAAIQYNHFANIHFKEFARMNIIPEFEIQPILDEKNQIISGLKRKLTMIRTLLSDDDIE